MNSKRLSLPLAGLRVVGTSTALPKSKVGLLMTRYPAPAGSNSMKKVVVFTNLHFVTVEIESIIDLNDGLVAYYPFNGNANDESGNGNDGVVNGATPTLDRNGVAGSAFDFDGDDFIKALDSETLRSGSITLSCRA